MSYNPPILSRCPPPYTVVVAVRILLYLVLRRYLNVNPSVSAVPVRLSGISGAPPTRRTVRVTIMITVTVFFFVEPLRVPAFEQLARGLVSPASRALLFRGFASPKNSGTRSSSTDSWSCKRHLHHLVLLLLMLPRHGIPDVLVVPGEV